MTTTVISTCAACGGATTSGAALCGHCESAVPAPRTSAADTAPAEGSLPRPRAAATSAATTSGTSAGPLAAPVLREATFDDFAAIHRLESRWLPDALTPEDRRRLFTDNPLWPRLQGHWPVGWVLEDETGEIVGTVGNVPSAYLVGGEEKVCAHGHAWAVAPEYRGYAVLLMDEYFRQPGADLFVGSPVDDHAVTVWQAYAAPLQRGDWSRTAAPTVDGSRELDAGIDQLWAVLAPVAA